MASFRLTNADYFYPPPLFNPEFENVLFALKDVKNINLQIKNIKTFFSFL